MTPPPWWPYWNKNVTSRKTAPPPGDHVFSLIWTIFKLVQDINATNVFTKNTAPPPPPPPWQPLWASNVTSTVFELSRGIIGTNVLTKFHEDRTRNVASRVFTRQNVDDERRTDDGQKAIPKAHHEHVVLR
ncbi:hypothetical protein DPMN_141121 [Dreissena polymorpha]|uniref:Uncharacterized protein n=1 Tax=Dreissena polymorpha TaxID=45954 RepID=A0A9D4GC65_DREPO|nr:hypothetical protein DPMN_141121 [Dreissena polymorpha]